MVNKSWIAALALCGAMLFGGTLPALGDARSDCEKRVRRAEENLQREIQRHGERGKNVESRRRDLERERQNCRAVEQQQRRNRENRENRQDPQIPRDHSR